MPRGVPEAFRAGATAEPSVLSSSLSHKGSRFDLEFAPGASPDIHKNNYIKVYDTIPQRDVPDSLNAGAVSAR